MFNWSFLLLTAALCLASAGLAQQIEVESHGSGRPRKNEVGESADKLPFIRYGSSRSSARWVGTPSGPRVAVDEGIEWQGKKIYISLTWSLAATPADSDVALWNRNISAFWDQVGIESFERKPGEAVICAALRSRRHPDLVEYRSLETGERIGGTDSDRKSPGAALELGGQWQGAAGKQDEACHELVRSAEDWLQLRAKLFGDTAGPPPKDPGIDFEKQALVVLYAGRASNCNGFSGTAFENDEAIVLRIHAQTYQSMGDTPPTWPWGIFAVPLRPGKDLVVERNRQNMIGGPALWRECQRWTIR